MNRIECVWTQMIYPILEMGAKLKEISLPDQHTAFRQEETIDKEVASKGAMDKDKEPKEETYLLHDRISP